MACQCRGVASRHRLAGVDMDEGNEKEKRKLTYTCGGRLSMCTAVVVAADAVDVKKKEYKGSLLTGGQVLMVLVTLMQTVGPGARWCVKT